MRSAVRKHVRRSRGAWQALLDEQAVSGLSQKAFCAQRGLALSSFCNARRRATQAPPAAPAPEFVALELTGARASDALSHGTRAWDLELTLFDGVVLRMRRR